MEIKVLGPGCARCEKTLEAVSQALAEAGVQASVEKVTGMLEIAQFGVMGTPAVVIDGKVRSVGQVPSKKDVLAWLKGA
jgi:small redox-active disulfide protein 2